MLKLSLSVYKCGATADFLSEVLTPGMSSTQVPAFSVTPYRITSYIPVERLRKRRHPSSFFLFFFLSVSIPLSLNSPKMGSLYGSLTKSTKRINHYQKAPFSRSKSIQSHVQSVICETLIRIPIAVKHRHAKHRDCFYRKTKKKQGKIVSVSPSFLHCDCMTVEALPCPQISLSLVTHLHLSADLRSVTREAFPFWACACSLLSSQHRKCTVITK